MKSAGNALAAGACLVLSCALAGLNSTPRPDPPPASAGPAPLIDASGRALPSGDFQRIACASTVAAEVVPELVSTRRIIAVPDWFLSTNPRAFRCRGIPGHNIFTGIETTLRAHPDLVLINSLTGGGSERVERLRELGLTVVDLGPMQGLATLLPNIRLIGQVLDVGPRAEALAESLSRRLQQVAAHIPPDARRSALYLGYMGGHFSGGTRGSSYHDLLHFAGLRDAAATLGLSPWPQYSIEQLLTIDPELIVTEHGHAAALRAVPALAGLRALRDPAGLIELQPHTETAALGLLPACEQLCDQVYGQLPRP